MTNDSHICHTYPDGRWCVATTSDPALAVALVKAVLAMKETQ